MSLSDVGMRDSIRDALDVLNQEDSAVFKSYQDRWAEYVDALREYKVGMLDFISGDSKVEPEEPIKPDPFDSSELHTREDFTEAWGRAFLEYLCENIEVRLGWSNAKGVNVSGDDEDDPTMSIVFADMVEGVSWEAGGEMGVLTPPAVGDVMPLQSKLAKLTALVGGLAVSVPAEPTEADVFTPSVIFLKSLVPGFILSGGDNFVHVTQGYIDGVPNFDETLRIFCSELIASIKAGLKNKITAHHVVSAVQAVVPSGFTGNLEIVSIS
jgi:hypothetical protein